MAASSDPSPGDLLGYFDTANALARKEAEHQRATEALLFAVTQALDSFSRLLNAESDPSKDRVRLIERQLRHALTEGGYEPIGSPGEIAAPETHKVIDTRPAGADTQEDEVVEVLRLGCRHRDRVLRPAEVIVAVPAADTVDTITVEDDTAATDSTAAADSTATADAPTSQPAAPEETS